MLTTLTLLAHVLLIGPTPASAQDRADAPEIFVDEDESRSEPREAIDLRVSPEEVTRDQPSRAWFERPWVWALIGSAVVTVASIFVFAFAAANSPPPEAESFCSMADSGSCIPIDLSD